MSQKNDYKICNLAKKNKGFSLLDILEDINDLESRVLNGRYNEKRKNNTDSYTQIKFLKTSTSLYSTESESLFPGTSSTCTVQLADVLSSLDNINGLLSIKNNTQTRQNDGRDTKKCKNYLNQAIYYDSPGVMVVCDKRDNDQSKKGQKKQISNSIVSLNNKKIFPIQEKKTEINCNNAILNRETPLASHMYCNQYSFFKGLLSRWKGKEVFKSVKDKIVDIPTFFSWKGCPDCMDHNLTCGAVFETLKEYSEEESSPPKTKSKRVGRRTAEQSTNYREKKFNRHHSHSKCESSLEIELKDACCQFDEELSSYTRSKNYSKTVNKRIAKTKQKNSGTQALRDRSSSHFIYDNSSTHSLSSQFCKRSNLRFARTHHKHRSDFKYGLNAALKAFYSAAAKTQKMYYPMSSSTCSHKSISHHSTNSSTCQTPFHILVPAETHDKSQFKSKKKYLRPNENQSQKLDELQQITNNIIEKLCSISTKAQELYCSSSDSPSKPIKSNPVEPLFARPPPVQNFLSKNTREQPKLPINLNLTSKQNQGEVEMPQSVSTMVQKLYCIATGAPEAPCSFAYSSNYTKSQYNINTIMQKLCSTGIRPLETYIRQSPTQNSYFGSLQLNSTDSTTLHVPLSPGSPPPNNQYKQLGNLEQGINTIIQKLCCIATKKQENYSNCSTLKPNSNNIYFGSPSHQIPPSQSTRQSFEILENPCKQWTELEQTVNTIFEKMRCITTKSKEKSPPSTTTPVSLSPPPVHLPFPQNSDGFTFENQCIQGTDLEQNINSVFQKLCYIAAQT